MATEKITKKTKVIEKAEVKNAKAESAKQNERQQKSDEIKALQEQEQKKKAEKKPSGVVTTAGNVIRHARVMFLSRAGVAIVSGAVYGKLIEGKKGKDAEANLKKLPNRAIPQQDYLAYQRSENQADALAAVIGKVYPMHVDDKTFENGIGQVGGHDVNYVTVRRVTDKVVENGFAFENQIGKMKLMAGIKGSDENRLIAYLTPKEEAMCRHRANVEGHTEMKPNKEGKLEATFKVDKVLEPITLLDLANVVAARQAAYRDAREANLNEAKGIDWGKYAVPIGAKLSRVHTSESNDADRVWINGEVNKTPVKGVLLTPVETIALREGLATKEQVFMHNSSTRSQTYDINKVNYLDMKANSEAYSVNAIVARAKDPSATATFTREQVDIINLNIGNAEDRQGAVKALWEKAEVEIKKEGVDESWLDSVKDELKDIASQQWKEKEQSVSVGR